MALTGIEIFKMLPKTNCKECGFPTCLAFAMSLASGKAELDKCPYVSDEAKEKLAAASAPPIRPVKLTMKEGVKTIGGETVMFRHEKTFLARAANFPASPSESNTTIISGRSRRPTRSYCNFIN
jgi:acetyl-CoA decarbonylase/synthase complex subunit gamma